jgi:hypothetical protein
MTMPWSSVAPNASRTAGISGLPSESAGLLNGIASDALAAGSHSSTCDRICTGISGRPSESAGLLNGIASDAS